MRKSRLGWYKQARLIELFVAGATGRTAARLVGVNKTTADYFFRNNIRGSDTNGTKLSSLSPIFSPVRLLHHLMPWHRH